MPTRAQTGFLQHATEDVQCFGWHEDALVVKHVANLVQCDLAYMLLYAEMWRTDV